MCVPVTAGGITEESLDLIVIYHIINQPDAAAKWQIHTHTHTRLSTQQTMNPQGQTLRIRIPNSNSQGCHQSTSGHLQSLLVTTRRYVYVHVCLCPWLTHRCHHHKCPAGIIHHSPLSSTDPPHM